MATIQANTSKSIFQIQKWAGLNESPDGDTGLAMGQAAVMRNFHITREGHLQIRPGFAPACSIAPVPEGQTPHPVRGLWQGYVGERTQPVLLAACAAHLWLLSQNEDETGEFFRKEDLGPIPDSSVSFFGFQKKVYLLTGSGFFVWDGAGELQEVEGYIPLTMTASPPEGGGTLLEQVNKLTGKRRNRFSPDGTATVFHLAETGIHELVSVEGEGLPEGVTWSVNLSAGTVSFSQAPPKGVNSLTITYRKGSGERAAVEHMRFAEFFGGNDSRVFLYGDGSNQTLFSGLDENGTPCAEYFPDLNVAAVGAANTPLNALIRHYDRMLCFKPDGAWVMEETSVSLPDGSAIPAFSLHSIHRELGCDAPGQARLIENNPWTLTGNAVFAWALANAAVRDERNAQRMSDPVCATIAAFDPARCVLFDDSAAMEVYIVCDRRALLYSYAAKTWSYYYTAAPMRAMIRFAGELFFGSDDGTLYHLSRTFRSDNGLPIDAYWESGSMDFKRDWMRKYSTLLWLGLKPEFRSQIHITVRSDRKGSYPVKTISISISFLDHVDFAHFSFNTSHRPKMFRVKIKVKKAAYYKLILYSNSAETTATVLGVDVQVRYTGNVK